MFPGSVDMCIHFEIATRGVHLVMQLGFLIRNLINTRWLLLKEANVRAAASLFTKWLFMIIT